MDLDRPREPGTAFRRRAGDRTPDRGPGDASGFAPDRPPERARPEPAAPEQARPDRFRRPPPAYAALDLGTNNCRLLIARPAAGGFQVIDSFSRIIRLGEGVV
ncbi:MAG: Ppx/GppA family phosphatase, partial [Alphaproteobacteria bacterium]